MPTKTIPRVRLNDHQPARARKKIPAKIQRVRFDHTPHPLRLYRITRLAALLDVHITTIWRWVQEGILPQPIEISPGVRGWPEPVLVAWLDKLQG
ncbi:MAG: helix-turn-helix transcriptional regulator [Rhodomicrobiaceae bacterium]